MLVIVCLLDLQLHVKSVHITTSVVSSNPDNGEVYSIQHYVIKFVSDLQQVVVFTRYSGFYLPILLTAMLKVALHIIALSHASIFFSSFLFNMH